MNVEQCLHEMYSIIKGYMTMTSVRRTGGGSSNPSSSDEDDLYSSAFSTSSSLPYQECNFLSVDPARVFYLPPFHGPRAEKHNVVEMTKFMRMYIHANKLQAASSSPTVSTLTFSEKPGVSSPLRIDVDFLQKSAHRLYTKEMIDALIVGVWTVAKEMISPMFVNNQIIDNGTWDCLVLEKSTPRPSDKQGVFKDGLHLHFPHLVMSTLIQDVSFVPRLRTYLGSIEWLNPIQRDLVFASRADDHLTTIIDQIARKTWFMYGSAKKKGAEPFRYTRACRWDMRSNASQDIGLVDVFPDYGSNEECMDCLPVLLSLHFQELNEPAIMRPDMIQMDTLMMNRNPSHVQNHIQNVNPSDEVAVEPIYRSAEEIEHDTQFLHEHKVAELLGAWRSDSYLTWIEVGRIIHDISGGSESGFTAWHNFSKQSPSKYISREDCYAFWRKMRGGQKTVGSILWLLKQDAPEKFKEIRMAYMEKSLDDMYADSKSFTPLSMARTCNQVFLGRFKCARNGASTNELIYEYTSHRWQCQYNNSQLVKAIQHEYLTFMKDQYAKELAAIKPARGQDPEEATSAFKSKTGLGGKITKSIGELSSPDGAKKIAAQLCLLPLVNDHEFYRVRDRNTSLLGCTNGVLDCAMGVFRPGRPDDMITMNTRLEYNDALTWQSPEIVEVMEFMQKIFPDETVREFALAIFGLSLTGGNPRKKFTIFNGVASSGKSKLFLLYLTAMGDYAFTQKNAFIIAGKHTDANASGTDTHMIMFEYSRGIVYAEIPPNKTLDSNNIKITTGLDHLTGRGLYQLEQKQIEQYGTSFGHMNGFPVIDSFSEAAAVYARLEMVPCTSRFVLPELLDVEPVPETFEEQLRMRRFKADTELSKIIKSRMAAAFLWVLFEYHKKYKTNAITQPALVKRHTQEMRMSNDILYKFASARLEMTNNDADIVSIPVLYAAFRDYLAEISHALKSSPPSLNAFSTAFITSWPKERVQGEDLSVTYIGQTRIRERRSGGWSGTNHPKA